MACRFAGKTILITGAGRGIGNGVATRVSKEGGTVIAVDRSCKELEKLLTEFPATQGIAVDLKKWDDIKSALCSIPMLDGLVNNAGIAIIKPFAEITEKDFDDTFDVNTKAVFRVTQVCSDKLKKGSSIVNMASISSSMYFYDHSAYCASKAAVDSLTRGFAYDLGSRNIRVNSLNPTVILTAMGKQVWSDKKKAEPLLKRIPLGRFGEVEDAVNTITFLLSDESSYYSGHHFRMEGGLTVA